MVSRWMPVVPPRPGAGAGPSHYERVLPLSSETAAEGTACCVAPHIVTPVIHLKQIVTNTAATINRITVSANFESPGEVTILSQKNKSLPTESSATSTSVSTSKHLMQLLNAQKKVNILHIKYFVCEKLGQSTALCHINTKEYHSSPHLH